MRHSTQLIIFTSLKWFSPFNGLSLNDIHSYDIIFLYGISDTDISGNPFGENDDDHYTLCILLQ